jgi:hypothetical protein
LGDKLLLYDLGAIKVSTEAEIKSWHEASITFLKQSTGTKKQPATRKTANQTNAKHPTEAVRRVRDKAHENPVRVSRTAKLDVTIEVDAILVAW